MFPIITATGTQLIADERREQLEKHGLDGTGDDKYKEGQLAIEAAMLTVRTLNASVVTVIPGACGLGCKQMSRIHQLKVAGALIAAEIDRLLRADPNAATN